MKLGQVEVGSNIAQNQSPSKSYLVIICSYSWPNVKSGQFRLVSRKSYQVIIDPSSHERLAKSEIRSSWNRFKHGSKSFQLASRKSYLVTICPNSYEMLTKCKFRSSWSRFEHCSKITHQASGMSYLVIICPNSHIYP